MSYGTILLLIVTISGEVRQVTDLPDLGACRDAAQIAISGRTVEAEVAAHAEHEAAVVERAEHIENACRMPRPAGGSLRCAIEQSSTEVPPEPKARVRYARCLEVPEALPAETPLPPPRPSQFPR